LAERTLAQVDSSEESRNPPAPEATVPEAFEDLYFFEKAAQTLILAKSTGEGLSVLSDEVARNTAEGWLAYRGMGQRHFDYLKSTLDSEGAGWRG
jgi:hypothetical protein